jgi:hypothetical protein
MEKFLFAGSPVSESGNFTDHIPAAAHGRFDLSVPVGAFGNMHLGSVFEFYGIVHQRGIALGACGIHAHSANRTFIG